MGFFLGNDHNYVVNYNFDKQSLSKWKMIAYVRWGIFKIFISNVFWLIISNQNLMQSIKNELYYISCTMDIFFEFLKFSNNNRYH
jgi:hypothetical protein